VDEIAPAGRGRECRGRSAIATFCDFVGHFHLAPLAYLCARKTARQIRDEARLLAVMSPFWPFTLPFVSHGRASNIATAPIQRIDGKPRSPIGWREAAMVAIARARLRAA